MTLEELFEKYYAMEIAESMKETIIPFLDDVQKVLKNKDDLDPLIFTALSSTLDGGSVLLESLCDLSDLVAGQSPEHYALHLIKKD